MQRYKSSHFAGNFDRIRHTDNGDLSSLTQIERLCDLEGRRVAESGAGTGFFTELLASKAKFVHAYDGSPHMVNHALKNQKRTGMKNISFDCADHRYIPLPDNYVDIAVSAWTLPPFVYECDEASWKSELDRFVREMCRIVQKRGFVIFLSPTWRGRRDYQSYLEQEYGFKGSLFDSSMRFSRRRSAKKTLSFYFGKKAWQTHNCAWKKDYAVQSGIWWLEV